MESDILNNYKVKKAPPSVFYIPNFLSEEDESELIRNIYSAPKPKWTHLSNRRLQDYGGVPHEKGMIPEKIPLWLQKYIDRVNAVNIFKGSVPNQVLINEYLPGQGIMPHTDGPLFYPTIATISCGSHTLLSFFNNNVERNKICDLLLERHSLVIIKDDMYSKYLHSIEENVCDILNENCFNLENCSGKYNLGQILERETRISITIRNVPKVLKVKLWN